ncbi:MAG: hypothetical protein AMJ90_06445 [candidate division Zixibacteria bacterium SM23_73_2]|nr:MAG: hypothetical protein AMJ90_06445 [candidate division Zixibacteria bacterium SM23_73_2]
MDLKLTKRCSKDLLFNMNFIYSKKVEADRIWWSLRTSNPLFPRQKRGKVGSIPTPSANDILFMYLLGP